VADPKSSDDIETIQEAGSTPEDGPPSTGRGIQPPDDEGRMPRSAESGEGEVPDETHEKDLEEELPSNRAQERGGP
jgi:hypothetical protein